jgi:hypothetical protein
MKLFFATIGVFVLALWLLGTFGIGNFVLLYSPDKITCTKDSK